MVISESRFPLRKEIVDAFAVIAFVVFSWAIIRFFDRMGGWLYYLTLWEVLSIFAYTQVFALVESLLVALFLLALATILPARLFRARFVAISAMLVLVTAAWAIAAHLNRETLQELPMRMLAFWLGLYGLSVAVIYVLVQRYQRVQALGEMIADRLAVLLYFYIPISLVSLAAVLVRNIL